MIKLTNLNDLITSLISKSLGNPFSFIVYPQGKGTTILEFTSIDYKFIVSKRDDGLRIYDKGNIYLISNILPDNFLEDIDNIIKQQAENLSRYYKLEYYLDKINKDLEANVYRFVKLD